MHIGGVLGLEGAGRGANILAAKAPSWVFADQVDANMGRQGSRHSSRDRSRG